MFRLIQNVQLKEYNTFGISVEAGSFLSVQSAEDLVSFFSQNPAYLKEDRLILGGGSNLLFTEDFDGLIIHPEIKGINILNESAETVELGVGAGEVWDDFVDYCVENGWGGVENLSLIPGKVGAVPIQNIGAYGVEADSSILQVNILDLNTFELKCLTNKECKFGYRKSIFKNEFKNRYLVTSVVFRLLKVPAFNLSYGVLKTELANSDEINLKTVRQAVISIRNSKLPDPKEIGNAGSFFKNPIVKQSVYENIKKNYPEIPVYPCNEGKVKLAAGWLIEKAGWKGKSLGNAAVHDKQALVLVNKGKATGEEIFQLSEKIRFDVSEKFDIELDPEVNIIGLRKRI